MRSLGADDVIDYVNEDFTKSGRTYDVIFDAAGKTTFLRCKRSLKPDGIYIATDPGFHVAGPSVRADLEEGEDRDRSLHEA